MVPSSLLQNTDTEIFPKWTRLVYLNNTFGRFKLSMCYDEKSEILLKEWIQNEAFFQLFQKKLNFLMNRIRIFKNFHKTKSKFLNNHCLLFKNLD